MRQHSSLIGRIKTSWRTLLICLLLVTATLATFWSVVHHDFVNYDDNQYVTDNEHILGVDGHGSWHEERNKP